VFVGYNGEALDEMTPLMRSSDVLSARAIALLELLGDAGVQRVGVTLGAEQEYFLVDRQQFALRPDLVMAGRTLVGAAPPRGQQLEDHYFGGIPERIQACIAEIEYELYKLGVPIVTRHNEVAPSQFEMAPRFTEADLATDHNQLVMATLRKVALRHGLQAVLHEKPFAGINGSGKHCNWAMSIAADNAEVDGLNLLKPGKTPHQNVRFLIFLAAVLQAVHKHAGLLRAGIATAGNEHRLGANEAPPAIISVFMGQTLSRMIEDIVAGTAGEGSAEQQLIQLGVAKLPEIEKDNTDRNRTSPFAFTGAKFEFRAVGSSQSIAFPVMLLNAAVAEAVEDLTAKLRKQLEATKAVDDAVLAVVRESFRASSAVRFEGNGYSDEWVREAEGRGLKNLRRTPEALEQLVTDEAKALFRSTGILTEAELESRYHVRVERYVKDMLIEVDTLAQLVDTLVLPAAYGYANALARGAAHAKQAGLARAPQVAAAERVGGMIEALEAARARLGDVAERADAMHGDPTDCGRLLTGQGADRWPTSAAAPTRSSWWWATSTGRCPSTGRCSSRCNAGAKTRNDANGSPEPPQRGSGLRRVVPPPHGGRRVSRERGPVKFLRSRSSSGGRIHVARFVPTRGVGRRGPGSSGAPARHRHARSGSEGAVAAIGRRLSLGLMCGLLYAHRRRGTARCAARVLAATLRGKPSRRRCMARPPGTARLGARA
jgi:glutamine synthetase